MLASRIVSLEVFWDRDEPRIIVAIISSDQRAGWRQCGRIHLDHRSNTFCAVLQPSFHESERAASSCLIGITNFLCAEFLTRLDSPD